MSEFLQRNKKKGALALVLLFLQRGKGLGPLLFLLLLLSFVFIAPNSSFLGSSWLAQMGKRLGLRGELGSGADTSQMASFSDALRRAPGSKQGMGLVSSLFGLGLGGSSNYGKNTVDMVKGGKGLADGMGGEKMYDGVAKGAGKSVGGVLRPEDSKKFENGVSLSDEEMQGGMMQEGLEGVQEGLGVEGLSELRERLGAAGGAGAPKSMFQARASDKSTDLMKGAFGGSKLPNGTFTPKGSQTGQLSQMKGAGMRGQSKAANSLASGVGTGSVMYQLAEGKAYSVAAAPPPGNCDPGSCPGEFARNASGAVFDGNRVNGNILSSDEFGDPGVNIPDQSTIDTAIQQASKAEEDAKKCEQAEETYGGQERAKMEEIQNLSNQLNNMNCASGGCSKSKYKACMAVGDQMRGKCHEYNSIAAQKAAACPLMEGKYSAMDCSQ